MRILHRNAHLRTGAAGESEQTLYGVSAWHEAPFYTDRERAEFERHRNGLFAMAYGMVGASPTPKILFGMRGSARGAPTPP